MSAILDAKRAVERRLVQAFPSTAISFENVEFKPTDNLYLRTAYRINKPIDNSIGNDCYREDITFTVYVCDKLNIGTTNAIAVAEQVRDTFYRKLTLQENTTKIHILQQPQVSSAIKTVDRLVVAVVISLTVEVNQ